MHIQFIKLPLLLLCISFALLVTCQKTPTGLDDAGAVRVVIVFDQVLNQNDELPAAGEMVKDSIAPEKAENSIFQANSLAKTASSGITNIVIVISGADPVIVNVSPGETITKTIDGVSLGQQTVRIDLRNSEGIVLYTQSQTVTVAAGETTSPNFPAEDFITQNVVISITAPNGGENWDLGSTHDITWNSNSVSGLVKIELYQGGSMYQAITSGQSNTGSYSWAVPSSLAAGTNYRVRVSSETDINVYDESDVDFALIAVNTEFSYTNEFSDNSSLQSWYGTSAYISWLDYFYPFDGGVLKLTVASDGFMNSKFLDISTLSGGYQKMTSPCSYKMDVMPYADGNASQYDMTYGISLYSDTSNKQYMVYKNTWTGTWTYAVWNFNTSAWEDTYNTTYPATGIGDKPSFEMEYTGNSFIIRAHTGFYFTVMTDVDLEFTKVGILAAYTFSGFEEKIIYDNMEVSGHGLD